MLQEYMQSKGFACPAMPYGKFTRFDRDGTLNAWAIAREFTLKNGKKIVVASFGDWRTGEKYDYKSIESLSPEEKSEVAEGVAKMKEDMTAQLERQYTEAAGIAQAIWNGASPVGPSPYFERKGLNGMYGCRIDRNSLTASKYGPQTIVPMIDANGKLWGTQRISGDGFKSFQPDVRVRGCLHWMGKSNDDGPMLSGKPRIYICEGVATAASVLEAVSNESPNVATAFNAGNMPSVAKALRKKFPQAEIVICADNDQWTAKNGKPWNPGLEYAERAAAECGGRVVYPEFRDLENKPTDFNDLHVSEGIEAVRNRLSAQQEPEPTEQGPGAGELQPLPPVLAKNKKGEVTAKEPPHQAVADALLSHYGQDLIKQGCDLFEYTGRYWRHLTDADHDNIRAQIQILCGGTATAAKVESIYTLFMIHCPAVPENVNMFSPSPFMANFANGTLHITRDKTTGKYDRVFKQHAREDYATWVCDIEYDESRKAKNTLWERLLEEVFEGDPDKAGKIRALKQCAGAMLMPAFPQLFMLHGVMGSRKSTIAKVFLRLVGKDNYSTVEPCQMEGFHMEDMIGKIVNIKTDIATKKAFPDGFLKQLEDRIPVQVNRKGKKVVRAMLPGVHVFCCNALPPMQDGESRAYNRRVTLIEFEKNFTEGQQYIRDYDELIFEAGANGILDFATEGLLDLLESGGVFTNPESGRAKVEEWQIASDPVGLFLEEARSGDLMPDERTRILVNERARIERKHLWDAFKRWWEVCTMRPLPMSKFGFYDAMRNKKYQTVTIRGARYFDGIGVVEGEGAEF